MLPTSILLCVKPYPDPVGLYVSVCTNIWINIINNIGEEKHIVYKNIKSHYQPDQ